jgi:hypothetical protein
VASGGNPDADIVTTPSYSPPAGGTLMLTFTDPPAVTLMAVLGAVTVKVGSAPIDSVRAVDVEVA